jgi:hypothetical protein
MMDLDFEIQYKKVSEMPADLLSRSFWEINVVSALNMNWADEQKRTIKKILSKKV